MSLPLIDMVVRTSTDDDGHVVSLPAIPRQGDQLVIEQRTYSVRFALFTHKSTVIRLVVEKI
jgi:hypothetical protein